jgi:hypothetical protein
MGCLNSKDNEASTPSETKTSSIPPSPAKLENKIDNPMSAKEDLKEPLMEETKAAAVSAPAAPSASAAPAVAKEEKKATVETVVAATPDATSEAVGGDNNADQENEGDKKVPQLHSRLCIFPTPHPGPISIHSFPYLFASLFHQHTYHINNTS